MSDGSVTIDLSPRERRLYDRLRAAVVAPRPGGERSGIRDGLLLLPDLTALLFRLLRDPRVPPGGKVIALLGIGYVLSPIDLIPEGLFGPLGLVDDLFIVGATLSRLLNYVHPDVVRSHWSGQGDALDAIQRASNWAEQRVRGLVRRLLPRALRLHS
ncbi:DUF1232 domain-containing protein [Myxococcota bacterium]|nr:DUF1232 domain-containing protein [Myxococcota bacterium]MCZ7620450.1 DUF1232 domain-containing protein [Myxococcota bacterium]